MLKKALYIVLGSLTLALGIIGIVVRGIPTTPLLLLTLMFYSKGSQRLDRWFRGSVFYKKFLEKYDKRKALTLRQKITIQLFAAVMMTLTFIVVDNIIVRIAMVASLIIMNYVFIFRIKTYRPEDAAENRQVENANLDSEREDERSTHSDRDCDGGQDGRD